MKFHRLYLQRLTAIMALAILLFNFPMLGIVSDKFLDNGWPVSLLYLFAVWALLILALALISRKRRADG